MLQYALKSIYMIGVILSGMSKIAMYIYKSPGAI